MRHAKKLRTVALVAAALLLLGTANASAAGKIGGNDIKKNAVGSKHIKKNAVLSNEIKDQSIKNADIAPGTISLNRLNDGAQAQIDSGYEVSTFHYDNVGAGNIATVACSAGKVAVGGGYWFNTAGDDNFDFAHPAITNGSAVIASFPGRMDFDGVDNIPDTPDDNTVIPGDNSGWIVQVNSRPGQTDDDPDEEFSQEMTLYVTCVNP